MKKLSETYKLWLIIRAREELLKKKKKNRDHSKNKERNAFKLINNLDIENNFEETISNLISVEKYLAEDQKAHTRLVDFRPLKNITTSSALILASLFDRNMRFRNQRGENIGPALYKYKEWEKGILTKLNDIGLLDFLATRKPKKLQHTISEEKYIRFRSAKNVKGAVINELQDDISKIIPIPHKKALYAGLSEATINSHQHAYPNGEEKNWWISSSYSDEKKELTVIAYDAGVGIPATLPRNFTETLEVIFTRKKIKDNDSNRIKVATELKKSRTKEDNRGNGLQDIKNYIYINKNGVLKIYSSKGEYQYIVRDGIESEKLNEHITSLKGTLIEWKVTV